MSDIKVGSLILVDYRDYSDGREIEIDKKNIYFGFGKYANEYPKSFFCKVLEYDLEHSNNIIILLGNNKNIKVFSEYTEAGEKVSNSLF